MNLFLSILNERTSNPLTYLKNDKERMCYINDNDFDIELYLAGGQGELKHMNLYLAESGGCFKWCHQTDRRNMNLYLAGTESRTQMLNSQDKTIFYNTNILQSFYYVDKFTENVIIPHCKNFLLDSGAFTFMKNGKNIEWIAYIEKYADFINRNNINNFFELDIDKIVGYDKVLEFRKLLEDRTGKKCIPVWHQSRGKNEFIKMCEEYNYVAIGGIAGSSTRSSKEQVFPWFISTAHEHNCKIHGLGYTSLKGLTKYHFDSVDSTSWVTGNQFGYIWRFDGKTMQKHDKPVGTRLVDSRKVALHNFKEWKKYQNYATFNL